MNLSITFQDCWEFDKLIPEDQRWLAYIESLPGIAVAASTKDKAFDEIMISLKIKIAYESNYDLSNSNRNKRI